MSSYLPCTSRARAGQPPRQRPLAALSRPSVIVGRHEGKPDSAPARAGTVGGLIAIARRPRSRSARAKGQALQRCRRSSRGRSASSDCPVSTPPCSRAAEAKRDCLPHVLPRAGRPLHRRCRSQRRSPRRPTGGNPVEKIERTARGHEVADPRLSAGDVRAIDPERLAEGPELQVDTSGDSRLVGGARHHS